MGEFSEDAKQRMTDPEFDQARASLDEALDQMIIVHATIRLDYKTGKIDEPVLEEMTAQYVKEVNDYPLDIVQSLLIEAVARLADAGPRIALSAHNEAANRMRANNDLLNAFRTAAEAEGA